MWYAVGLLSDIRCQPENLDVVLLDLDMLDALEINELQEIMQSIKHVSQDENVIVVGTVCKWTTSQGEMCIEAGLRELFVKPFDKNHILCALDGFVSCDRDRAETLFQPDNADLQPGSGLPALPPPTNQVRVLYADDNPTSLKFGYHILNLLGCQVECVTCGEEAVWSTRQNDYDIVYMDLHMPGMNGYEATKWIKQEVPVYKQPAILAITGDTSSGVTQRCVEAGMTGYITKPTSKDKFAQSIVQSLVRPGMRPGMREALGPCARGTTITAGPKAKRVNKWISSIDNWNFNAYTVCQRRPGPAFCELGMEVFRQHGLLEEFSISYEKLLSYLTHTAMKHSAEVSFHNVVHACSVLQAMHFFLKAGLAVKLQKFDILVLLFVCSVRNVDHPGVNNAFVQQITNARRSSGPVSNVDCVLERHHINISFEALQMPQLDFLGAMPKEQFEHFKRVSEELMLVTDMSRHAEIMTEYFTKATSQVLDATDQADRLLLMKLAVKCADWATTVMKPEIFRQAADLFFHELHQQGDRERAEGLSISPLCDRASFDMVAAQQNIIKFMVEPLYLALADSLHSTIIRETCLKQLESNLTNLSSIFSEDPASED